MKSQGGGAKLSPEKVVKYEGLSKTSLGFRG